jgi:hypothetical protein
MNLVTHRSWWRSALLLVACWHAVGAASTSAQDAQGTTSPGTTSATTVPSAEQVAANAVITETPSEEGDRGASTNVEPTLHGDDVAGEEEEILPPPGRPISRDAAEAEEERRLDEEADRLPPPPPPEWRLRAGAGVGLPLNGANVPYLRLHEEIEWQPTAAVPFIFGLGGAEYVLGGVLGSAGARIGAATDFCSDATVRCQAALNLVLGAFFGQNLLAFDFGGEGDVRFLFGSLELSVRVGFGGGGGINMLFGSGGIGGAF